MKITTIILVYGLSAGLIFFAFAAAAQSDLQTSSDPSGLVLASGPVVFSDSDSTEGLSPDTRILPKHLFDRRKNLTPVTTPKGYRPAWQDGRMNPRRAEGTLRGNEQMNQIWTQTVPRRLIVPK